MMHQAGIELYWLPLGAGGWFVRLNGRIWETIQALWQHRRPLDLYHTALVVRVPAGRFVVENCWPIPNADGPSRGVLVEGPVGSRWLGRWRVFRYEVDTSQRRRWRWAAASRGLDRPSDAGSPPRWEQAGSDRVPLSASGRAGFGLTPCAYPWLGLPDKGAGSAQGPARQPQGGESCAESF